MSTTHSAAQTTRLPRPVAAPATPVELIAATSDPDLVTVPARLALAIDGAGLPSSAAFHAALGALYGVAYALRFERDDAGRPAFSIGALEARWSAHGWRLRIAVPNDVKPLEVETTKAIALARASGTLAGSRVVPSVFLEPIPAQRLGRILRVGARPNEVATLARLDSFLIVRGDKPARAHLEVYLSDPRNTVRSSLRTVLLRELG